jgi:ABC-2 type transport system permease protein
MNKIFLWFVSSLSPVLEKTGVDTYQLYEIVKLKLMMDDRRPRAVFAARRNSQNSGKVQNPWAISLFTVLLGVFLGCILFLSSAPYIAQTLYFTMFMVLMGLTLISDFTTVLIDPRDQFILLPRPVNDRTIVVSRILHIGIYVLRLALLQSVHWFYRWYNGCSAFLCASTGGDVFKHIFCKRYLPRINEAR